MVNKIRYNSQLELSDSDGTGDIHKIKVGTDQLCTISPKGRHRYLTQKDFHDHKQSDL